MQFFPFAERFSVREASIPTYFQAIYREGSIIKQTPAIFPEMTMTWVILSRMKATNALNAEM